MKQSTKLNNFHDLQEEEEEEEEEGKVINYF